jgi:hypothetical protein
MFIDKIYFIFRLFILYFLVKPKVEAAKNQNELQCVFGEDCKIEWKFSGIEKPTVEWNLNGQPIKEDDRIQKVTTEDGVSTLTIKHTTLADKGIYSAKATNSVGEAEAKTTLNITGIKPIIATDLEAAVNATKGETLTLKLKATGTPQPDVLWAKGNDDLVASDHIKMSRDGDEYTLTINNVQPEDIGEYSAKITNVGGTLKSKKCKVNVTSKWQRERKENYF